MAGFDVAEAKEVYSIPDDYEPVAAIRKLSQKGYNNENWRYAAANL